MGGLYIKDVIEMTTPAQTLAEAILAKCQRNRWFGPDYYSPRRYDGFFTSDFDPFPDEEGNFPAPTIDAARDYSPIPLDSPERTGFVYPKATPAQVTSSERMLGFALPPVLRELYQELANGGFGPVAGLRGIEGGYNGANREGTILDFYPTTAKPDQLFDLALNQQGWLILPEGRWPRRVLCLGDMGCVQEACVHASTERMYIRGVTADDRHALEPLPWTLEEWLWRWVRDEDLLERYPPGAA